MRFFSFERGHEDYRIYEIAGPAGISFNDLSTSRSRPLAARVKRRNIPRRWVERAIFLKGLFKDVTKERRGAGYFSLHHEHDIRPAISELKWTPRTFAEGIQDVVEGDWWRSDDHAGGQAQRLGTGGV